MNITLTGRGRMELRNFYLLENNIFHGLLRLCGPSVQRLFRLFGLLIMPVQLVHKRNVVQFKSVKDIEVIIMGKLIFLDIDGTIIAPGQPPSRATVEAICSARANGHKVFISTGRSEANIPEEVQAIGFDGGIYSAGGRAVVNGTEILNRPMPAELVRQVKEIMRDWNLFFMLESTDGTYAGVENQNVTYVSSQLICYLEQELHGIPQKQLPKHGLVYKIDFLARSKAQAEQLAQKLSASAKVVHYGSFSPDDPVTFGEISGRSATKGAALISICRHLGADVKDCIAFGDSMNDIEILQTAGIGVVMGNAEDCVKEFSDQVCERCDEDGIAKTLARMKLI